MNLASSPPVPILPPQLNGPSIKNLLEEALELLDDARSHALAGKKSSDCLEAILLQVMCWYLFQSAIVALELRQDGKTSNILKSLNMSSKYLAKWHIDRSEGKDTEQYSYLSSVIYSPELFKRLLIAAPSGLSKAESRLTLSRRRTSQKDFPVKVQCSYCSMQCINTGIKCENCAEMKIFTWYCTEECRFEHLSQHKHSCGVESGGESPGILDFSSFLPNLPYLS